MPKSLNRVQLLGNVGKEPDYKTTQNGNAVCNFKMATTESYKQKDEWQEKTEWHNVTVWGNLAETVNKYVNKGSRLMIEGKLQTRSYDDKDGIKRYVTEVIGQSLIMLDGKKAGKAETAADAVGLPPETDDDSDIPF